MPATAARIAAASLPPGFERVVGSDGSPTYQRIVQTPEGRRVEWLGGTSMPAASAGALTDSLEVASVNGIGLSLGSGHEWATFARQLPSARGLYVYEPDEGFARMALEVCDLSAWLRTGKIIVCTGPLAVASEELSAFLASRLGFEPPTVLHPLPTISAERRNGLLSAGEALVRRVVVERQSQVQAMAVRVEQSITVPTEAEIALVATARYPQERPLADAAKNAVQVLAVDSHASAGIGLWLAAMAEHRPRRIVSDFFRAQLGCVPAQVAVETWIPPLVGAGFWDRVPAAETFAANDRIVIHGAWHLERLADRGIPQDRVDLKPLQRQSPRLEAADSEVRTRVALIGDFPSIEPEALGIELPTHVAVYAAAWEMVKDDYLTVQVSNAGDLLRRALRRVGVTCENGEAPDPALREPMLRLIRDVLIPTLPLILLAEHFIAQGVPLRLIGEWPGVVLPAGDRVVQTPFSEINIIGEGVWADVAVLVHLSPSGMVSPLLMEAIAEGVVIVSPRHGTDHLAGSVATLFVPEVEYAAPVPQQLMATVKSLLRDESRRDLLRAKSG